MSKSSVVLDRATIKVAIDRIKRLLGPEVAGLLVAGASARWSATEATIKLSLVLPVSSKKSLEENNKLEWGQLCASVGLKKSDFGKTFMHRRREFKVVGLRIKRTAKVIASAGNKRYLFDADTVKLLLKK